MRYKTTKQFAQIRLYNNHSNQKNNAHDYNADSQKLFQIFQSISGKAQKHHNAQAPNRCYDMCRNAGQGADTQSSTRQITAHISKAAYSNSHGNQTYKEFSEQRTVIKSNLQGFRQILLGYHA